MEITNWNINPNIRWFGRFEVSGEVLNAELYTSQADATAQTSRQAYGSTYGTELRFVNEDDSDYPVEEYNDSYSWHAKVYFSGEPNSTVIKRIGLFGAGLLFVVLILLI